MSSPKIGLRWPPTPAASPSPDHVPFILLLLRHGNLIWPVALSEGERALFPTLFLSTLFCSACSLLGEQAWLTLYCDLVFLSGNRTAVWLCLWRILLFFYRSSDASVVVLTVIQGHLSLSLALPSSSLLNEKKILTEDARNLGLRRPSHMSPTSHATQCRCSREDSARRLLPRGFSTFLSSDMVLAHLYDSPRAPAHMAHCRHSLLDP